MRINYTSRFQKSLQKQASFTIKALDKKLKLFRQDPFAPGPQTHKLKGELAKYWVFSVSRKIRVLFIFENDQEVTFINIGSHEIYR